jgi:hypothetical protein
VHLPHKLLLLEGEALLFDLEVLETLSVVPGCVGEVLLSSLQFGGLELELFVDRE